MKKFNLRIFSQEGLFFKGNVDYLEIKGTEGYLTVLYDHIPLMTSIVYCNFIYSIDNKKEVCYTTGGILFVKRDSTIFISDSTSRVAAEKGNLFDIYKKSDKNTKLLK